MESSSSQLSSFVCLELLLLDPILLEEILEPPLKKTCPEARLRMLRALLNSLSQRL
jgi:hypothetical protein